MLAHPDKPAILAAFEAMFWADLEDGSSVSREQYQAMFPGFEDLVGKAFDRLHTPPSSDQASQVSAIDVSDFVAVYREDERVQRTRTLAEYCSMFRGREGAVARKFAELDAHESERTSIEAGRKHLPDSLGGFRLLDRIARGGQASVYHAERASDGLHVALKVLGTRPDASRRVLERFQREAEIVARLEHPQICTVRGAGVEHGYAYIAFDFIAGESLAKTLSRARKDAHARIGIDRSLEIVESLAETLHVAHGAGVVHRDIKPGNIILREDGLPVVLDFGLAYDDASLDGSLTRTGDLFGTPAYMSPEQIDPKFRARGARRVDARSDVYALGAIAFELLTSRRPFEAAGRHELYEAILTEEPPRLRKLSPTLPAALETIVETALHKNVDRRYQSARDLAVDLRRARAGKAIRAHTRSRVARVARAIRRRPALSTSLGLALAATLVNSVLLWTTRSYQSETEDARQRQAVVNSKLVDAQRKFTTELVASYDVNLASREAEFREWRSKAPSLRDLDEWRRKAQFVLKHSASPDLAARLARIEREREVIARLHLQSLTIAKQAGEDLRFGHSACSIGDLDGDGRADLAIGAPYDERSALRSGSVRAFSGKDGSRLDAWSPSITTAMLGYAIHPLGDVDGDGRVDFAIGAPCNAKSRPVIRQSPQRPGFLRVYSGASRKAIYQVDGDEDLDLFGSAIARIADTNQDGADEILVVAPGIATRRRSRAGFARLLSGRNGTRLWSYRAPSGSSIGSSASRLHADLDGDRAEDLILTLKSNAKGDASRVLVVSGRKGEPIRQFTSGTTQLEVAGIGVITGKPTLALLESKHRRSGRGPSRIRAISATDGKEIWRRDCEVRDRDFTHLQILEDLDGDGCRELAVGSTTRNREPSPARAWVLSGRTGVALFQWSSMALTRSRVFVHSAGDIDGDGREDLAIGLPKENHVLVLRLPPL